MSALVRYDRPGTSLASLIDEVFNGGFFYRTGREVPATTWPHVDIVEEKEAYKIRADLPGIDKKDVKVSVEGGVLSISGEKQATKQEEKNRYYHLERSYGSFSRSFGLPENVDTEHIEAGYKNGLLELTLRKTEKAKPKAIEVKVG